MVKRRITYRSARNKGKTFERTVAKSLTDMGIDAKRVPMSGALSWLKGDVVEFNTVPAHVHECKNQEALSINTWWEQAVDQVKDQEVPVLHFTSNYKSMFTMITSEVFDEMLFAYENYRGEINVKVIDVPPRKNFWKFSEKQRDKFTVFMYDDRVIILLSFYLLLRRYHMKHLAASLILDSEVVSPQESVQ